MKKLLLFFTLILCLDTFSQVGNVAFSFEKNLSKVIKANKILREEVYSYIFNKNTIKDSSLVETYLYDTIGNLIQEKVAKSKIFAETIRNFKYSYNSNGQLVKQINENVNLKSLSNFEFEYDAFGNEITKYDYNKDTTRLTIEKKIYNKNNQLIELQTKINNHDFYTSKKYYYDNENNLIKIEAYNNRNENIYFYIYEYKSSNNSKTVFLENDNGKNKTDECFYNLDKQIIKVNSVYKSVTFITQESTEYNKFNKLTVNIYNPDKTIYESTVFIDNKIFQVNRHFYFKE